MIVSKVKANFYHSQLIDVQRPQEKELEVAQQTIQTI